MREGMLSMKKRCALRPFCDVHDYRGAGRDERVLIDPFTTQPVVIMKRLHVALRVDDLDATSRFYTALFGAEPTVQKDDYAKWMLDDPRVNFSVIAGAGRHGIEHLGIQAEDEQELQVLYEQADRADAARRNEGHTTCCYARSEKAWATDPQGVEWELFHTYGAGESLHGEAEEACCEDDCCAEPAVA